MIFFKTVRWKNIFSYGDHFTEIQLDRSPSTLITGENGSGKSTVSEAITFALFGKPFRRIKKNDMINTKNGRGALVEIEFELRYGKDKVDNYLIRRGMKPDIFEVFKNNTLLNQPGASKDYQATLQNQILRCDYNIFTQIVMIGEATHVSFMRASAKDRRTFVETVLNLNVFGVMNKIHSTQLANLKERISDIKSNLALAEQSVEYKRHAIRALEQTAIRSAEAEVGRVQAEISGIEQEIKDLVEKKENIEKTLEPSNVSELNKARKKSSELQSLLNKVSFKLSDTDKNLEKLEKTDVCHACGQGIPEDIKQDKMKTIILEVDKLKIAKEEMQVKQNSLDDKISILEKSNARNNQIKQEISALEALINDRKNRLRNMSNQKNAGLVDNSGEIAAAKIELVELERRLVDIRKQREEASVENEYNNLIKNMLQDTGIKASMIKRFLPIINQSINHNLAQLGFFGKFTLDENFEETIQARGFEKLAYNSYSEGEKLRIDLAVLMAWRQVANLQGIMSTNLLFFDEVIDASMDASGTEAFATLLSKLQDSNVFIISHSPEKISDKVRSQITFTRNKKGFSKFKESA